MSDSHLQPVEAHLSHPLFQNALSSIDDAAKLINCDRNVLERLKRPKRCIAVSVPVRMDDYTVKVFTGYRVQYNSTLGPYKGGIRFHQNVDMGEVVGLACLMTIKNSVMGLPYGGGKGGVTVDPTKLSRTEKQNLTRRYTSEIGPFIGPAKDIPAPDVGTDAQTMAWMMDTYSQETGYAQPGVVTGKPVEIGGSLGRAGATGLGAVYVAEKAFEKVNKTLRGSTIAIQGFGNVGSHAAQYAFERGAKILAVSDVSGGVFNGDGLNIPDLLEYIQNNRVVKGYPKGQPITNEELLVLDCDALFPCALEGVIDEKNAEQVKARMIIEGANGPTTPAADDILASRNVLVLPDVIANAGGVTVSYFEWVQDFSSFFWDEDEINARLVKIMKDAFASIWNVAQDEKVSLRTATFIVACKRILHTRELRGLYP